MKTGTNGIQLIENFEGFSSLPYLDSVGVPTIGYGSTYYNNGAKVALSDPAITTLTAVSILQYHLGNIEQTLNSIIKVPITQNQFDSLVSFCYNLGVGALEQSTLLKKLNVNPNDPTIEQEFMKWVNAGGHILPGLQMRRQKEANLYFQ